VVDTFNIELPDNQILKGSCGLFSGVAFSCQPLPCVIVRSDSSFVYPYVLVRRETGKDVVDLDEYINADGLYSSFTLFLKVGVDNVHVLSTRDIPTIVFGGGTTEYVISTDRSG